LRVTGRVAEEALRRVRNLIKEADPQVVEEWKWAKATSPGHSGLVTRRWDLHGRDVQERAFKALIRDAVALNTSGRS
jgi:hypothetical protein